MLNSAVVKLPFSKQGIGTSGYTLLLMVLTGSNLREAGNYTLFLVFWNFLFCFNSPV